MQIICSLWTIQYGKVKCLIYQRLFLIFILPRSKINQFRLLLLVVNQEDINQKEIMEEIQWSNPRLSLLKANILYLLLIDQESEEKEERKEKDHLVSINLLGYTNQLKYEYKLHFPRPK